MSPRVVLSIGAVAAAIFGLGLLFLPVQMLAGFGLAASTEAVVLSRDIGVTLLALAVLNWLGRTATGQAVRAILIANLFLQVAELVVNGYELAVGDLPVAAAGGLVLHIVLGALFAWALYRSTRTAEREALQRIPA